jgi:rare lipoprotein A
MHTWYVRVAIVVVLGGAAPLGHLQADPWHREEGIASWYGRDFAGKKTASGEPFSPQEMTAAHRRLPLGTKVVIENPQTGDMAEVKITDRGPYVKRRIIDLSHAAADSIGLVERGVQRVRVSVSEPATEAKKAGTETVDYEVQVGAFTDQAAAQEVLAQVQQRYPAAYIVPRNSQAGPDYRIRVGPFETEEQAEKMARALKQQGHRVFLDEVPE